MRKGLGQYGAVAALLILIALFIFGPLIQLHGIAEAWAQISIAIILQAIPFLILGVIISGFIEVFVPEAAFRRLPRSQHLAVPTAAASGMLLPACECASVPITQSLIRRGVPPAAALAFLLASPAINPVVLVSTAVAFGGDTRMMLARFVASLSTAVLVGWIWISGRAELSAGESRSHEHQHHAPSAWERLRESFLHDLLNAGGYLVLGALLAGMLKLFIPRDWFLVLGDKPVLACLAMAVLAVLLALCSEADAFIAASFTMMPPTAQLVFLVVGPMVDVKLMAMQRGAWGNGFIARFVPLTFAVALLTAIGVGALFFGDI
ncbi:permease [Corynebacterium pseudotuberculosis]|uniref:Permease n=1 Tax=Corynebacterium pseudotuberculosis 258 TaxID=1168865 RepID=A0AAU8PTL0_CORPS|nr:permease [Corynebacterium pseudotuberculosis]AER68426.1 Permease [Corynebacterium pseudotuberculosis 1/06-A]AEQ05890.1 permease [Corynebacterium pseudotuberculosis CIP 52.97]AFB71669.1 permease [Corynebacterium pseudotuberculosis 316]AFK15977.1 permease [Corynebacterium pseudotuberculosis 258]AKS12675.1 Permease [Corynebacterium pseudotuberculosis]